MAASRLALVGLLLKALAWLAPALAAWYFASPFIDRAPAGLAAVAIRSAAGKVGAVEMNAGRVSYEITLAPPYRAGGKLPEAQVSLEANARKYSFGLALFIALALASPPPRRVVALAAGAFVVALVPPTFGIAFDVLRQLMGTPELRPYLDWGPGAREAVALGFQFGSLLAPTLVPVACWLAANPALVPLMGGRRR